MGVSLCKRYKLDQTATKNLIEVLVHREKEHDTDIKRDLDKLEVHLEHSSAPSKLVSMKLKEMRGGCNIGAVWHCCGDSKKRPKDKEREVLTDKGPSSEALQMKFSNSSVRAPQRAYRDQELS